MKRRSFLAVAASLPAMLTKMANGNPRGCDLWMWEDRQCPIALPGDSPFQRVSFERRIRASDGQPLTCRTALSEKCIGRRSITREDWQTHFRTMAKRPAERVTLHGGPLAGQQRDVPYWECHCDEHRGQPPTQPFSVWWRYAGPKAPRAVSCEEARALYDIHGTTGTYNPNRTALSYIKLVGGPADGQHFNFGILPSGQPWRPKWIRLNTSTRSPAWYWCSWYWCPPNGKQAKFRF